MAESLPQSSWETGYLNEQEKPLRTRHEHDHPFGIRNGSPGCDRLRNLSNLANESANRSSIPSRFERRRTNRKRESIGTKRRATNSSRKPNRSTTSLEPPRASRTGRRVVVELAMRFVRSRKNPAVIPYADAAILLSIGIALGALGIWVYSKSQESQDTGSQPLSTGPDSSGNLTTATPPNAQGVAVFSNQTPPPLPSTA